MAIERRPFVRKLLTAEQQELAIRTIQARAGDVLWCPMCRKRDWTLSPELFLVPALYSFGSGQPCVALICSTCGNVQQFNLLTLGIARELGAMTAPPEPQDRG